MQLSQQIPSGTRSYSTKAGSAKDDERLYSDEELCIPAEPTWSLNELFKEKSTSTELDDKLFEKLCRLAALEVPASADEKAMLKNELSDLIGLVDAVRAVDTSSISAEDEKHSTIWPQNESLRLQDDSSPKQAKDQMIENDGTQIIDRDTLLKLAKRRLRNSYVVNRD